MRGESEYGPLEVRHVCSMFAVCTEGGNSTTCLEMSRPYGESNLGQTGKGVSQVDDPSEDLSGNCTGNPFAVTHLA